MNKNLNKDKIKEEEKFAQVIVPDDQLSLAIGKSGQNARLAAKLTNWKIDIKSESQFRQILAEAQNAEADETEEVEAEEAKPYEIYVYNKGGRLLKQFGVDTVYDEVKLIDNVIAGFSGNVCYMIRTNGSEAFYGDMGKNIVDILPTNSKTEFLFVYSESCARVRLRNEIIMEEETETVEIEE